MKFNYPTLPGNAREFTHVIAVLLIIQNKGIYLFEENVLLLQQKTGLIVHNVGYTSSPRMTESLFTFRVQLHVDEVSHNRRLVKRLHGHFGSFHILKNNFGNPQVLFVLRIVQDLHLLDFSKLFAHVGEKSFPNVVVQPGECHLLRRHRADITLVDLEEE